MKKKSNLSIFLFVQLFLIESVFQQTAFGDSEKSAEELRWEALLRERTESDDTESAPQVREDSCTTQGVLQLTPAMQDLADSARDCVEERKRVPFKHSVGVGADEFQEDKKFCECVKSPILKSEGKDSFGINYRFGSVEAMKAESVLTDYLILSEVHSFTAGSVQRRTLEIGQRNDMVGHLHVVRSSDNVDDSVFEKLLEIDRIEPSCVSFNTFLEIQRLPKEPEDKAFLDYFGDLKKVNPNDWNLDRLKEEYNQAFRSKDKEKLSFLKSKITFLKSNPLYGSLLSSENSEVKKSQKALLKALQTKLQLSSECDAKSTDCFEANRRKKEQNEEDLAKIFKAEQVGKVVREFSIGGVAFSSAGNLYPRSPAAFQRRLQLLDKPTLARCYEGLTDTTVKANCLKDAPDYCARVNYVIEKNDEEKSLPFEDLLEGIQLNLNPDRKLNPAFRDFEDAICNKQHMAFENGKIVYRTLMEFKKDLCPIDQPQAERDPACSNYNRLLAAFLIKYPLVNDPKLDRHFGHIQKMLVNNLSITPDHSLADINMNSIDAMRNSSVSQDDVQKLSDTGGNLGDKLAPTTSRPQDSFSREDSGIIPPSVPMANALPGALAASQSLGNSPKAPHSDQPTDRSRDEIMRDLERSRESVSSTTSQEELDQLNKRIKGLEEMLAKKDKDVEELMRSKSEKATEIIGDKTDHGPAHKPATKEDDGEDDSDEEKPAVARRDSDYRSPASVGGVSKDSPFGSANIVASQGQSANAIGRALEPSAADVRFNDALLSKYGISVQDPSSGTALMAQELEPQGLIKLSTVFKKEGKSSVVSAVISDEQFEKVRGNDLANLTELYEKKFKKVDGNVVKISLTSEGDTQGKNPVEFYVVREAGKIVFQPVRKFTRESLLEAITN